MHHSTVGDMRSNMEPLEEFRVRWPQRAQFFRQKSIVTGSSTDRKLRNHRLFDRIEDAELRRTAATKLIEQEVTEITEIRESD
jgi:hypothetical protein